MICQVMICQVMRRPLTGKGCSKESSTFKKQCRKLGCSNSISIEPGPVARGRTRGAHYYARASRSTAHFFLPPFCGPFFSSLTIIALAETGATCMQHAASVSRESEGTISMQHPSIRNQRGMRGRKQHEACISRESEGDQGAQPACSMH